MRTQLPAWADSPGFSRDGHLGELVVLPVDPAEALVKTGAGSD